MRQYFKWMLWAVLCFSIAGCSNPNSPKGVAKSFWDGVLAQDEAKVKEYSSVATKNNIDFSRNKIDWKEMRVKLGATHMLDSTATVNTTVQNKSSGVKYTFNTYLVKEENGAWRIDYVRTRNASITSEIFSNLVDSLQKFNQSLSENFEDTVSGFKEVAPDIKKELDNLSTTLSQYAASGTEVLSDFQKKLEAFKEGMVNWLHQPASDDESALEKETSN